MFALPSELCFDSFHWYVFAGKSHLGCVCLSSLSFASFLFSFSPFPASVKCVFLNVLYYFAHHIHIVVFMFLHCTQNAKLSQSLIKKQGYSTGWKKYGTRPKIKKKYN